MGIRAALRDVAIDLDHGWDKARLKLLRSLGGADDLSALDAGARFVDVELGSALENLAMGDAADRVVLSDHDAPCRYDALEAIYREMFAMITSAHLAGHEINVQVKGCLEFKGETYPVIVEVSVR